MRFFLLYWLPVVLWMALIFYMSTARFSFANTARLVEPILRLFFRRMSGDRIVAAHMKVREIAHFGEYMILSVLLFRAFRGENPETWQWNWMLLALAVLAGYAFLDELHQRWEAGRTGRLKHVWIDLVGGVAGQLLIAFAVMITHELPLR